ncbi:cysteine desulfurase NifS [Candidatus Woesearchaeota archaeon]|nr:cysteine desulfurase NifS [Candidatus Woesearchaeota archaeon]
MSGKKVYLDNAATTEVDEGVINAMIPFFKENYGNASSLHTKGQEAKKSLEEARKIIAQKINAEPEEIVFTSGGTESDKLAIKGAVYANKEKGKHIITTKAEHPAVLGSFKSLWQEGFEVTYLDVDKEGFVDLKQLKKAIKPETILVSVIHANNEIGTINDITAIGQICKEKGILFHSDAVQSFTKTPIDVKKMNIDLLSMSAHKIHGPKGVGALFVRKGVKVKKQLDGGAHEFRLRAGTENVAGIVGFVKAVELITNEDIEKITKLRDKLMKEIEEKIPEVILNGPRDKRICNNAGFSFKHIEGESLLMHLDAKGICVSTGSACSSASLKPSHVLMAIGLEPEIAHGSIRFRLSKYNTEEEIDYVIENLIEIVKNLRAISPL